MTDDELVEKVALTHIELRPTEIQSGFDRVKWAEGLIRQLPEDHDGRNSWLLNYAGDKHAKDKVSTIARHIIEREAFDEAAKVADDEDQKIAYSGQHNIWMARQDALEECAAAIRALMEQSK